MADKTSKSTKGDGFDLSSEDGKLVMSIVELNFPNFSVKGWNEIAAKNGLSVATAKQRFGSIKNPYKKSTDGVVPAAPVILKRKRGVKGANIQDDEEEEEEEDLPANTGKQRPARQARASRSEVAAAEEQPEVVVDAADEKMTESDKEIEEAASILISMKHSKY